MTPAGRPRWPSHLLALAPAWLAAIWVARHAWGTFFTPDDLVALARAAGLEPTPLTFRPLSAALAPRIEYAVFGLAPTGYHLVNLGLHLLATGAVYALALGLAGGQGTAAAAALLFACAGIAFTPLHAASGIGDLLACVLLLAATRLQLEGGRRGRMSWRWAAATVAAAAVLAKESAAAWPLVVLALERHSTAGPRRWRAVRPALATAIAAAGWLVATRAVAPSETRGPYALDFSPAHLTTNLATYAHWCVSAGTPMRDLVAAADPASLPVGLAVALVVALFIGHERGGPRHPVEVGAAWWLAFLLPVLPLAHHSYLYYLYIPWAGGAIAVAAAGAALVRASTRDEAGEVAGRAPAGRRRALGLTVSWAAIAALAGFFLVEARGVTVRERATLGALPADRTLREASLLAHALPALRAAALAPHTPVGFVNPVPGAAFRLPTGASETHGDTEEHEAYLPLEAALRGGRAIALFAPGLVDSGFAVTIPPGWGRVECFLYEQRGWLRHWGRGQAALMRQAELQAASGGWAAAESSFARVRSLGDTMPAALCGEAVALRRLGRTHEAELLADTFARRWPGDPRARLLRATDPAGPPDPRLVRPFDASLPGAGGR